MRDGLGTPWHLETRNGSKKVATSTELYFCIKLSLLCSAKCSDYLFSKVCDDVALCCLMSDVNISDKSPKCLRAMNRRSMRIEPMDVYVSNPSKGSLLSRQINVQNGDANAVVGLVCTN